MGSISHVGPVLFIGNQFESCSLLDFLSIGLRTFFQHLFMLKENCLKKKVVPKF